MEKPQDKKKDDISAREATQQREKLPKQAKREGPDHGRDEVAASGEAVRD